MKTLTVSIVFFAYVAFSVTTLNAQNTTLRLGAWQTSGPDSFVQRQSNDQLYDGFPDGIQRYSFWKEQSQTQVFPLGFTYQIPSANWDWVFRWNYQHRNLNQNVTSLDSRFVVTDTKYQSGYSSDMESDFGIKKGFFSNKLILTVRVGMRNHFSEFSRSELSLGANSILATSQDANLAWNAQIYPAMEVEWKLNKYLYPFAEVYFSSNANRGGFKSDSTRLGSYLGRTYWERSDLSSGYDRDLARGSLGGVVPILESLALRFGFREERVTASHGNVNSSPVRIASGGTFQNFSAEPTLQYSLLEQFSDNLIYQQKVNTVQKGFFLGVDYRF